MSKRVIALLISTIMVMCMLPVNLRAGDGKHEVTIELVGDVPANPKIFVNGVFENEEKNNPGNTFSFGRISDRSNFSIDFGFDRDEKIEIEAYREGWKEPSTDNSLSKGGTWSLSEMDIGFPGRKNINEPINMVVRRINQNVKIVVRYTKMDLCDVKIQPGNKFTEEKLKKNVSIKKSNKDMEAYNKGEIAHINIEKIDGYTPSVSVYNINGYDADASNFIVDSDGGLSNTISINSDTVILVTYVNNENPLTFDISRIQSGKVNEAVPSVSNGKIYFYLNKNYYEKETGNNVQKVAMDVKPDVKMERTLLPIKYVAEAIGADVKWDQPTQTATFTRSSIEAKINIYSNIINVSDGRKVLMDTNPVIISERIMVPITNIANIFGLTNGELTDGIDNDIEWDQENFRVIINIK